MSSFTGIQKQLADVAAIDFYMARQLSAALDEEHYALCFHVLLALSWHLRHGHTCLALNHIAGRVLFDDADSECEGYQFPDAAALMAAATYLTTHPAVSSLLQLQDDRLFTCRYWQFETAVAERIVERLQAQSLSEEQYNRLTALWPELFAVDAVSEQDWQQVATAGALTRRFAVINGGPGTGKTYTVARLLLALQAAAATPLTIRLAAPTGKAAQRLTESVAASLLAIKGKQAAQYKPFISTEASTLHRLLGIRPNQVAPRHDENNPIHCDVLIIDEASMVDIALMARVMRALPATASVYLVGDANQLPAVESGNVLESLTGESEGSAAVSTALAAHLSRLCPHLPALPVNEQAQNSVFTLQVSQRFGGALATVATAIREGNVAALQDNVVTADGSRAAALTEAGVFLAATPDKADFKALALASFADLMHAKTPDEALAALNACRWLTPVRQGDAGVDSLNEAIRRIVVPHAFSDGHSHYHGRPVMVTENDYVQRLFNGDTGIIWRDKTGTMRAYFLDSKGAVRSVSLSRLPKVDTVYAMTIHKSQGSEFRQVVMWVPEVSGKAKSLFTRELLYTGLTRAKQGCLMVGDMAQVQRVLQARSQRFSGLKQRIAALYSSAHSVAK